MDATKILLVEDDDAAALLLSTYFKREGIQLRRAVTGAEALEVVKSELFELILLDVRLPGALDGFDVCRHMRSEKVEAPILFLSAAGDEFDQVSGYRVGADDYVLKPFSPVVLMEKVKHNIRRYRERRSLVRSNPGEVMQFPGLLINRTTCEVYLSDQLVQLTAKEFELLCLLARHPGRVYSREQIFRQVWQDTYMADESTVTVHIRRLREKVEPDPGEPMYVLTVRGLGYRFNQFRNPG